MAQKEHIVNFPTKNKSTQDKQVSNVGVRYTKEGKLLGVNIDFSDVDNNKKKPATLTICVNNKNYVVNTTDLHDRYEALYYFCTSDKVTKQSLKEADFGVDYIISVLEKICIHSDQKVVQLITNTNAILLISTKKEYIIPLCDLDEELSTAIKNASSWKELLNYNKPEDGETDTERKERQRELLKFFSKYKSFKHANIIEVYRFSY